MLRQPRAVNGRGSLFAVGGSASPGGPVWMSELSVDGAPGVAGAARDAARGRVVYLTERRERLAAIVPAEFASAPAGRRKIMAMSSSSSWSDHTTTSVSARIAADEDAVGTMRSRCNSHRVTFDLESFALSVEAKAAIWTPLGVVWQLKPILPNHGKPVVTGEFESVTWIGNMAVWITGEAELATVRLADGWNVNKHYDLVSSDDLETALDELAALVAEGSVPSEAVTAWAPRGW